MPQIIIPIVPAIATKPATMEMIRLIRPPISTVPSSLQNSVKIEAQGPSLTGGSSSSSHSSSSSSDVLLLTVAMMFSDAVLSGVADTSGHEKATQAKSANTTEVISFFMVTLVLYHFYGVIILIK